MVCNLSHASHIDKEKGSCIWTWLCFCTVTMSVVLFVTDYTVWLNSNTQTVWLAEGTAKTWDRSGGNTSFFGLVEAFIHTLLRTSELSILCLHSSLFFSILWPVILSTKKAMTSEVFCFFSPHCRPSRGDLLRKCTVRVLRKLTPTFFIFQVSARGPLAKRRSRGFVTF